ncbi:MAG: hypothetical protein ACREUU_18125 [Gammaproteobacteria bacterium]
MPSSDKPHSRTLGEDIDELEFLLDGQAGAAGADPRAAGIPVLDDLVEPEDLEAPAAAERTLQPGQLVELSRRLQRRIDGELGDLADVIRNVVKRSIMEELRSFLPPVAGRKSPAGADRESGTR